MWRLAARDLGAAGGGGGGLRLAREATGEMHLFWRVGKLE